MLAKYATYHTEGNGDCYVKVDEQTRYHHHSFQQNHKVGRVTCVWPARRQTCHSKCCILAFMALLCIALHICTNAKHCGDFFLVVLQHTIKWGARKNNIWQWQHCLDFALWSFILLQIDHFFLLFFFNRLPLIFGHSFSPLWFTKITKGYCGKCILLDHEMKILYHGCT